MRTLALLCAMCLPVGASAQARLTPAERLLMGAAGAAAGTLVLVAGGGHAPALVLPASPLAGGLFVFGVGRALGHGGRLAPTLVGAGIGTLPALLLLGVAEGSGGESGIVSGDDLLRLFAAVAYVVVPPGGAVVGFESARLSPVVLAGPGGAGVAGLSLRVAL